MAWLAAPWVEASGVCHSDSATVPSLVPFISYFRVSGHEIVGRVDSVGEDVPQWKTGQRVGIGWHGGQWPPRRRLLPFPIHSRASMGLHCCAGLTTFNVLRDSGAKPPDTVAVWGIGGLGHLGVQSAARVGFNTIAIARGADSRRPRT
jgi:D-arabinose 1-dehydrogenase-like Zn-dependent alcohol dehydrogenase